MKEGGSNDNLAIAWQYPGQLREVIPARFSLVENVKDDNGDDVTNAPTHFPTISQAPNISDVPTISSAPIISDEPTADNGDDETDAPSILPSPTYSPTIAPSILPLPTYRMFALLRNFFSQFLADFDV